VIAFSINVEPRGKGRPRLSTRGGFARAYTDPKTRAYEAAIRTVAVVAMAGREPLRRPLSVVLRFRLSVPPSTSKRLRAAILSGDETYLGRIDVDNAAKAVLDALNGVCWVDDRQIVGLVSMKEPHAQPGIDVWIEVPTALTSWCSWRAAA
jgi:Holliday junction resolvase RusA-like endonuclease